MPAVLVRNVSSMFAMTAFGWGQDDGTVWREAVRTGLEAGLRWCFGFAGPWLRVYDAQRTHSRRFAEFHLEALATDDVTFAMAQAILTDPEELARAVTLSEQHRASVRASLEGGVHEALVQLTGAFTAASRRALRTHNLLDESLIVIYRILFLLFAEARGLVPAWHPVYRESYTVESLRPSVERLTRPRGIWATLQAMSRLAHRGCHAGSLRVPPFNGRLFSPAGAPLADRLPLDEGAVRDALLALTTRPSTAGRQRIAYGDLGVEQLGGIYERVLDYDLSRTADGRHALVRGGRRKATGTFYTPRSLTEHVVRRTLAPLVDGASPERILTLRILDPSMGSGAFLVAACRYLARAYESALIEAGGITSGDITDAERAGFRRVIAQRCLYGVDLNPMAVQLARLSLWLTTFAGDRPLTFFDHHLRTGNSLVGTSLDAVRRGHPARRLRGPLPLFDDSSLDAAIETRVRSLEQLRRAPEETLEQVRVKERLFEQLQSDRAPAARWKRAADLWCAAWFDPALKDVGRGVFQELTQPHDGDHALPSSAARSVLEKASATAEAERFFHWELEFPDVFHPLDGATHGFDAVIGNPPWEMVRGDSGDPTIRERAARAGTAMTRFTRDSGIYRLQGGGHANLYQLFVERSLALLREGGRLGLVLPSGVASDLGSARLRQHLLTRTSIDSFTMIENHDRLFPIHRSLKFVALTLTRGGTTSSLPLRAGIRTAVALDRLPESGPDAEAVALPARLVERLSGDQLSLPELRTPLDARIVSTITFRQPASSNPEGWGLAFGRELNASDDRQHCNARREGLPVIEGKHIRPFTVDVSAARLHIRAATVGRILRRRPFERARVAYRDVSSATNRVTLIAAVLPPGTITTHTLFCLRTPLDDEAQHFVCGLFNSFVANYLVRLRVTTHVTVSIIERLPLPYPPRSSPAFGLVAAHAALLATRRGGIAEHAALQAAAARLYGLDREMFAHILSTFPLVDGELLAASLATFDQVR